MQRKPIVGTAMTSLVSTWIISPSISTCAPSTTSYAGANAASRNRLYVNVAKAIDISGSAAKVGMVSGRAVILAATPAQELHCGLRSPPAPKTVSVRQLPSCGWNVKVAISRFRLERNNFIGVGG